MPHRAEPSASVNGFSIGCMYVRPWRLITATCDPVQGVVHAPAAAGNFVRAVVVRPKDPVVRIQERIDLALVPDVVAARDDVDARGQDRFRQRRCQPHAAGDVLAVGRDEVDAARLAQARQQLLDRMAARLTDEVADHQDAAGSARPRRIPRSQRCPVVSGRSPVWTQCRSRVLRLTCLGVRPLASLPSATLQARRAGQSPENRHLTW